MTYMIKVSPTSLKETRNLLKKLWPDLDFDEGAIIKNGYEIVFMSKNRFINELRLEMKRGREDEPMWRCHLNIQDQRGTESHIFEDAYDLDLVLETVFSKARKALKKQFEKLYSNLEMSLLTYKYLHKNM